MKFKFHSSYCAIVTLLVCLICAVSERTILAETLYDTLNPFPVSSSSAAIIGDYPNLRYNDMEFAFTFPVAPVSASAQDFVLTSYGVQLLDAISDGPYYVEFNILTDANGEPGDRIDSFQITGVTDDFNPVNYFASSTSYPVVTVGASYWIAARYVPASAFGIVLWNNAFPPDGFVHSVRWKHDGGPWMLGSNSFVDNTPSLRIEGTAVAEPSSGLLLLLCSAIISCRKSKAAFCRRLTH